MAMLMGVLTLGTSPFRCDHDIPADLCSRGAQAARRPRQLRPALYLRPRPADDRGPLRRQCSSLMALLIKAAAAANGHISEGACARAPL